MSKIRSSEPSVVILACESLAEEMNAVASSCDVPFRIQVFSSHCHNDPLRLSGLIREATSSFATDVKIFLAYGQCFPLMDYGASTVYRAKSLNCAAILLGGDERYGQLFEDTYFLTPYLARRWKEYFLGGGDVDIDPKTKDRLADWFSPIKRVVKIDIGGSAVSVEPDSAIEFASVIEKPIIFVEGSLDFLRNEYAFFCSSVVGMQASP